MPLIEIVLVGATEYATKYQPLSVDTDYIDDLARCCVGAPVKLDDGRICGLVARAWVVRPPNSGRPYIMGELDVEPGVAVNDAGHLYSAYDARKEGLTVEPR